MVFRGHDLPAHDLAKPTRSVQNERVRVRAWNISPPLEMYAGGGPTSKKGPAAYISSGRGHAQPIFFRFFSVEKKRKKINHFWDCVGEDRGHAQPILFRFFSGEKKRNKINIFFLRSARGTLEMYAYISNVPPPKGGGI